PHALTLPPACSDRPSTPYRRRSGTSAASKRSGTAGPRFCITRGSGPLRDLAARTPGLGGVARAGRSLVVAVSFGGLQRASSCAALLEQRSGSSSAGAAGARG